MVRFSLAGRVPTRSVSGSKSHAQSAPSALFKMDAEVGSSGATPLSTSKNAAQSSSSSASMKRPLSLVSSKSRSSKKANVMDKDKATLVQLKEKQFVAELVCCKDEIGTHKEELQEKKATGEMQRGLLSTETRVKNAEAGKAKLERALLQQQLITSLLCK